ncbi:MAG: methyltransferase domain-containing protein [bacterium]|nr:methyltransferase domain-containing protein [bacterium]
MKCCSHCEAADEVFNDEFAEGDLEDYRQNGPSKQTQVILDTLKKLGVTGLTLLDIGGGVGAIHHELLKAGAESAVDVDASGPYIAASRKEAQRLGHLDRITYRKGDFVALAEAIDPADIVTLDRVVCCYPDMPALVNASAARAHKMYALVFPVDRWYTRIGVRVINFFQWVSRDPFRFFIHPTAEVDALIQQQGLRQHLHQKGTLWQVMVYTRPVN